MPSASTAGGSPCFHLPFALLRVCQASRSLGTPPAGRGAAAAPPTAPPPDPVYAGKNAFIEKHKLVVFRLTQHWNQRKPDPRAMGLATAMGWARLRQGYGGQGSDGTADDYLRYNVPAVTLEALAGQLKKTLGTRGGIRAVGDRSLTVRKMDCCPGSP